jgi:hypothetical protein
MMKPFLMTFGIFFPLLLLAGDPVKFWDDFQNLKSLKKKERAIQEKAFFSQTQDISGYIIANEFGEGRLTEFLLTEIPGGCLHVPLPPPEKMIHVKMVEGKTSELFFGKRVIVKGKLQKSERIDASLELLAEDVKEFPRK